MSSDAANIPLTPAVPDHIPAHLVRRFTLEGLPGANVDAVQAAADAARQLPPIFFAVGGRRPPGAWMVTRHDLIREVYQDTETFSSRHNADFSRLIGEDWPLLPLEADPPEHANWRILLNPIFAPAKMRALEADIETLATRLVKDLAPKGSCEFVSDFAEILPIHIFLRMFGLPLDEAPAFMKWANLLIHATTLEGRQEGARKIVDYLRRVIADRRSNPTDDLISYVVGSRLEGRPLSDNEALGMCFLLYSAGLDTVASMLGFIFKHLAENPDDQQKLRDQPDMIPDALEEMLRAFPIVVSNRQVTRDRLFHGVELKAGDLVAAPTMFAGRDDAEFPNPDKVDFEREKVSHITFAAGPHRCVGSHLARRELRIALETWLKHIPTFRITPGEAAVTHSIGVFGFNRLPLSW